MERWRWYPRDLGNAHVLVNLPDFTLKVMHNGAQVWTTRIVIGKPDKPTPLLSETMKYITVNPTWNVPPSIVYNEYLPALRRIRRCWRAWACSVSYNRDGSVHIYQPPGDGNALGRIRFNFPNRFLVYQHDTPDKYLFAHDVRAYSHGCMRVQDPAEIRRGSVQHRASERALDRRADQAACSAAASRTSSCPTPIWVHLTYQTAFVDDAGKLQIRRDVYDLDSRTLTAIKSERGMVEPMQERKRDQEVASQQRPAARVAPQARHRASSRSSRPCSAAASRKRARPVPPRRDQRR